MPTSASNGIRRVADRLNSDPVSDGELLTRFLTYRDEAAFATVVRRHAAMIFGTCRRVLGNVTDVDDAFQATFVVLVRKAHSLTDRTCIGNFLYGIACRTALKARALALKRRLKEAQSKQQEPSPDQTELLKAMDEELARLPEKYREPVVLSELEGRSRSEVSSLLGIPEGTISSRLATAHRMLEKRLRARGFAAVCIAAVLAEQMPAATDAQADAGVKAAFSPTQDASQLAREVMKMLLLHKIGIGAAVLMVLLVGIATAISANVPPDERPTTPTESKIIVSQAPTAQIPVVQVPPVPVPKVEVPPAKEPAWKAEFRKVYGLKDGELIRRVAPPYSECRAEYLRDLDRRYNKVIIKPSEDATEEQTDKYRQERFLKFVWKDNWPDEKQLAMTIAIKPDVGVTLTVLLGSILGQQRPMIEVADELLERKVTGDYIVREGADPEKIIVNLEKILRKECELPVSLAFRDVEKDVYVLSGKYESKPLTGRKKNEIAVASELGDQFGGGSFSSSFQAAIACVEDWIGVRIVLGEIEDAPKNVDCLIYQPSINTKEEWAKAKNPKTVMNAIAAQTGLSVKLEKRKVKVLEVKKTP